MKLIRFYVNGEFWKSLEVSEEEMNQGLKKYRVATRPPEVCLSIEEADERMCSVKTVYFKLGGLGSFLLEDEEIYLEDGEIYLKEKVSEELQPDKAPVATERE